MTEILRKLDAERRAWEARCPRTAKFALNLLLVGLYAFYHAVFVMVPVEIFTAGIDASAPISPTPDKSVVLLPWVKVMWVATILAMFMVSAVLGAFQKRILRKFGRWALLLWVAAAALFLLSVASVVSEVKEGLRLTLDDNAYVLAYLAAWLVVLGYLSKLPWDEARERWYESMTPASEGDTPILRAASERR